MELDWLKVEPQYGQEGVTEVQVSILSVNEGVDREKRIRAVCGDAETELVIKQGGMREILMVADGDFILADGDTFNTLKNEQ